MNNQKKPTFVPVSVEEAKKIRAYEGTKTPHSGVECPSGGEDAYSVCMNKSEGDECCYYNNGHEVHGHCVHTGRPPEHFPDPLYRTECIEYITK